MARFPFRLQIAVFSMILISLTPWIGWGACAYYDKITWKQEKNQMSRSSFAFCRTYYLNENGIRLKSSFFPHLFEIKYRTIGVSAKTDLYFRRIDCGLKSQLPPRNKFPVCMRCAYASSFLLFFFLIQWNEYICQYVDSTAATVHAIRKNTTKYRFHLY